jgi:hypothetical protein
MDGSGSWPAMQSNRLVREIALLFAVVVLLYLGAFYGVEHLRARKGPWEVTFTTDAARQPVLVIDQPGAEIKDVRIVLTGEALPDAHQPAKIVFDKPQQPPFDAPFGRVVHEDLTFLPGAVTFHVFGHEIELLPRTLILNRQERPWQSGTTFTLHATNKLPALITPQELKKR